MLNIEGLYKRYETRQVLRGLGCTLQKGEIFGLLGPNGAGKTTTLKILSGLTAPDEGRISLNGRAWDRRDPHWKRAIAYVPDQPFLYDKLTGEEHIHFYADLYGLPAAGRDERIDFFFRFFEYEEYRRELVENYSAGTRQKLLITQALLVEPQLLLLDEPMVSIDPLVGRKFKAHLQETAARGTIILFATHILSLAQEVCHRIGLLIDGRIVISGTPAELLQASSGRNLEDFYYHTVMNHAHLG